VQPLVDKVTSKLVPWQGKNITAAGRGTLVKSVITSRAIFHITLLGVPHRALQTINKPERSFFWAGTDGAELIGKLFVYPKRRVGLASSTWINF
jgi:hypothetical protein